MVVGRGLMVAVVLGGGAARALAQEVPLPDSGQLGAAVRMFREIRYADAAVALETYSRINTVDPIAPYLLGRINIYEREPDRAVDWLELAVQLSPKTSVFHQWLGRAYALRLSMVNKARALFLARKVRPEFARAVSLDPGNVLARMDLVQYDVTAGTMLGGDQNALERARMQADEIVRLNPMRGQLAQGMIHEAEKRFSDAEGHYRGAAEAYPDSATPYQNLGALYLKLERYPEAADVYEHLVGRDPRDWSAYLQIGRTAALSGRDLGRGEEALKTYLDALPGEARPTLAGAHLALGQVYEQRGQRELAVREYTLAVELNPRLDEARDALARVRAPGAT